MLKREIWESMNDLRLGYLAEVLEQDPKEKREGVR